MLVLFFTIQLLDFSVAFFQFLRCDEFSLQQFPLKNQNKNSNMAFFADLFNGTHLVPVVQRLDNAIHRINHYPVDKC